MNWSKCKTIFIVFFCIIDVILLSVILYINLKDSYVSPKEIEAVSQYVASQDITIETNIPHWMPSMKNIELNNILRNDSPFLTQFFQKGSQNIVTENKTYQKDTKTLTLKNNAFTYVDTQAFTPKKITSKNVIALAKKKLKSMGFVLKDTMTSSLTVSQSTVTTYQFSLHKQLFHKSLEQAQLEVKVTAGGKLTVKGMWFNPSSHEKYRSIVPRSILDVLVSFCQDMRAQNQKNISITSMELCYNIDSTETYHRTLTASGCWKITTKDGKSYYYDIRE